MSAAACTCAAAAPTRRPSSSTTSPLYNPSHLFGFFSTFNPDAIKDVQLYKGAYPAAYGRTLGAVLDVSNREGNRQRFSGRGGISLIASRLLAEGPMGQGSWMMAGRRTYLEPVLSAVRSFDVDIPLNYYFYDFNGKVNQRWGDDTFTVSTYWGQDDLRVDIEEENESFADLRWGNRALTARWTRVFSPTLFGHFMAAGSSYENILSFSFFDTPFSVTNSIRDWSLKGDVDYFANRDHTVTLGFLATLFEFDYSQSFNQEEESLYQKSVLASAYVQDEWQAGPTTRLRLGGRGTYFSVGDRLHFAPRLSLSRALSENIRVKAAAGMYRQYLQLITTETFSGGDFWVPLDDTVEPGRSYQGVIGTEWNPSRRYQLSVEAYYTDLANLVVLDNAVAVDSEGTRSDDIFKSGGQRLGQRSRSLFAAAHWGTHRLDRLYAGLDAAHLPRTKQRTCLPPQVRPPPRSVFCGLVQLGEMAPWLKLSVRHWTDLYPSLVPLFAARADHWGGGRLRASRRAQQRPPAALSPPRCQCQPQVWAVGPRRRVLLANFQSLQPAQRVVRAVQHEQS